MLRSILRFLSSYKAPRYKLGQLVELDIHDNHYVGAIVNCKWGKYEAQWIYEIDGVQSYFRESTIARCINDYGDVGCL